jgi:hypothetical protein
VGQRALRFEVAGGPAAGYVYFVMCIYIHVEIVHVLVFPLLGGDQ